MQNYNLNNLVSVENIYNFFKDADYNVEFDKTSYSISELIEKDIDGEAWTIIDETNLTVLIIKSINYNRKSYRNKINNNLQEIIGTKIIFYTNDFTHYNLTLIFDGIFNIKFNPSKPEMLVTRILESIQNQEDLFDYTKQDVNFVLLKRELTANALKESIREGDNSSVKLAFQEGGLKLIGEGTNKIIISQKDAPIRDMGVDVKLEYENEDIIEQNLEIISNLYKENRKQDLKLVCIITKKGLLYYWIPYSISGFIPFTNQFNENVMDDVLESLIAQISVRTAFNSETFHQQFGIYSPFFILGITAFQQFFEQEQEKIKIMYEEWKSRFSKVYQTGDLDQELFIKHAYLSLIIKTVLISKFVGSNKNSSEDNLQKIIEIFEERGVPIFLNDFFQWTSEELFVQREVFESLHNAEFIIDDLFRTIYQEMVSPATRHALGEFYTPAPLAQKMVEEVYGFGQYVLDPACGSGTFLIEILNIIHNSNKKVDEKVEAISKIYGFDVNPIAVLVARSNLLLLTDKLFPKNTTISINVFLADSLNPINEFSTVIEDKKAGKKYKFSLDKWHTYGEVERFIMPAINDALAINIKLLKYSDQFGELLKELDRYLSRNLTFNDMLDAIYQSIDVSWLNELCEGSSDKKLKDNFEYIAKKLYDFIQKDKNHIWAYLLYNAIGVRKMRETMDGVDLIIGNPPWLTLNSILSQKYKEKVKEISKELKIYAGGKHAPNTEICSIFFYKSRDLYLKKNGKIFFVTTAAVESGDQHSRFRLFDRFKNVFMWKFLTDVFRIHNICVGGSFGNQPLNERLKIKTKVFNVFYKNRSWEFEIISEEIYVPNNLNSVIHDLEAKRLIPLKELSELLPTKESLYKNEFYKGADLFPRNFFFIKILENKEIVPDKSLLQHKPWNFYPVHHYDIEKDYIFSVCKSTELVPFYILNTCKCFLPIEKINNKFNPELIKPKARRLFIKFSEIYTEIQQRNQREITDLWDNLNYRNKLSNPMQKASIKVVYNGQGSILKSAVVRNDVIVDYSLFYIGVEDLEEAYYLCTILNAPCLTTQIEKTANTGASGSVRNIQKKALDFPIPKFNENVHLHMALVNLGKGLEKKIGKIIDDSKVKEYNELKKKMQCTFCSKIYSKKNFDRYRQIHEKECKEVDKDHNWSIDDWLDLENITLDEIQLGRIKIQNKIFNDPELKEKFEELDDLVIQLLNSEGE